ncbi:MAG: hypothetical protein KA715_07220 [Xanthomonadaceae bacterium]|nr:hypothetical protein [Xanthomonadaceae bacterium]
MSDQNRKLRSVIETFGSDVETIREKLISILISFYEAQERDVMIGFFFTGRDLVTIATKQAAFVLKATGLTQTYSGKSPGQAHTALPKIRLGQFNRRIEILRETLTQKGLTVDQVNIWIAFEKMFENVVVG